MTSVSLTHPMQHCPSKTLAISEVVNGNLLHTAKSACLDKPLFNDNVLQASCPYAKSQTECMDRLRSASIFKGLNAQPDIAQGKCGSLDVLASTLNLCTSGMQHLTQDIIVNPDAPSDQQTLARELSSVCHFTVAVPSRKSTPHCAPWKSE